MQEHAGQSQTEDGLSERIAALSDEKRALLQGRITQTSISGKDLVAECIHRLGITHVYSVSGTPIEGLLSALARRRIRIVGVHHQQAAVYMAASQNYVAGRLTAAVVVSAGPAVTNTTTGILVAHDNGWPVLVLAGRRPVGGHGMGVFQELDAVPVLRTITKWSATIPTTKAIPDFLQQAYQRSISGRPGPVFVELPEDVLASATNEPRLDQLSNARESPPECDAGQIREAVQLLCRAQRPAMIIGKGVRWTVPFDLLQQLIERLGIPFITSPLGRGFVSDDHPLCCNTIRTIVQRRTDVVLVVAARLNWMFRYGAELSPDAKIIQLDIHRDEIGHNCEPSVALHGDAGDCIRRLVRGIDRLTDPRRDFAMESWHQEISEAKHYVHGKRKQRRESNSMPISPENLATKLREFLPADAILVTDGNITLVAAQRIIPSHLPASRLDAGTNGCMGVGIPFAIGAKMARPDRPVVALCGDYGFTLSAMELETSVRQNIPILVIIANNHGLCGALKQKTFYPRDYPERVTMFQHGIRYQEIAHTLGCHSEFVEHPNDLRPALERAATSGRTSCVNVFIDPNAPLSNAWENTVIDASFTEH